MTLRACVAARTIFPAFIALGLLHAPAFAQTPAPQVAAAPQSHSSAASARPDRASSAMERIETRLSTTKAALHITDAQTAQWTAFAAAVRAGAQALVNLREEITHGARPKDWPARADWQAKLLAARLDALKSVTEAGQPLYAVLTADQKKQADKVMTRLSASL